MMKFSLICLFTLVALAFMVSSCKIYKTEISPGKVTYTEAGVEFPPDYWPIYYNWDIAEDEEDKYMAYHPAHEPNEGLYNTIPQAASSNGFLAQHIEKFSGVDATQPKYILVVFSREKLQKGEVTVFVKKSDFEKSFACHKDPTHDWFYFYTKCFSDIRPKIPIDKPKSSGGPGSGVGVGAGGSASGSASGNSTSGNASGSAGGSVGGSAGGSTSSGTAPAQLTPAEADKAAQACVDEINKFRATKKKLKPLKRWKAGEQCATETAKKDSEAGEAHKHMRDCSDVMGQNTCPGGYTLDEANTTCIKMMWDEGPAPKKCDAACFQKHGHYMIMSSKKAKKVACGFYVQPDGKVWVNHNFTK